MRNRRLPPGVISVAAFLAIGVAYTVARGTFTFRSLIFSLIAAAVIIFTATRMARGPYI